MQGSQSFQWLRPLDPHQGSALDPLRARQHIPRKVTNVANFGHEYSIFFLTRTQSGTPIEYQPFLF